jgi:transcriptional regulator with XRE-family HTH domain
MRDFADLARRALQDSGYSMKAAARAMNYDVAYLSRVLNGKQNPSAKLAESLDDLVEANGELAALVGKANTSAPGEEKLGVETDIGRMKSSASHLLDHADRYGGDTVAPAAVQVWRAAQRKLDAGIIPEKEQRPYAAAVAEAAEVAGWLLFDAGQWDAARTAFLESHMLARHAGDKAMQWFAMDMLAMLDVDCERPAGALRVADELLCQDRIPPRVALLARVRRGRALAQMGDHKRTLTELDAARGKVQESLSPRDPVWAWWVDDKEVGWHSGAALLDLDAEEAAPAIQGVLERISIPDGRGALHLRIGLLAAFTKKRAWREAEAELECIAPLLDTVSSGRNRHILRGVLRTIDRDSRTPSWVSNLTEEVRVKAA